MFDCASVNDVAPADCAENTGCALTVPPIPERTSASYTLPYQPAIEMTAVDAWIDVDPVTIAAQPSCCVQPVEASAFPAEWS